MLPSDKWRNAVVEFRDGKVLDMVGAYSDEQLQ
jgi:hypothetical protein